MMLVRNYSRPFVIAGFLLAEIYMPFVMLAPPPHQASRPLPVPPMEASTDLPPGAPVPAGHLALRLIGGAIFFGPFGALVGLGVGLAFSALMQAARDKGEKPSE